MEPIDVFNAQLQRDAEDPEGYRSTYLHVTKALGVSDLAVKLMEIPPGQSACPYHYEYEEEWLLVLEGTIVLRTPEGERELTRGHIFAFPSGPSGAHKTTNRSDSKALILMFSSAREPAVAVYPDSDKIGVWPGNEEDKIMLRRRDGAVDYFDGE